MLYVSPCNSSKKVLWTNHIPPALLVNSAKWPDISWLHCLHCFFLCLTSPSPYPHCPGCPFPKHFIIFICFLSLTCLPLLASTPKWFFSILFSNVNVVFVYFSCLHPLIQSVISPTPITCIYLSLCLFILSSNQHCWVSAMFQACPRLW